MRLVILIAAVLLSTPGEAQNQRTTCYDSGPTRICETRDSSGNVVSKSRCYRSGNETRCESSSSATSSSSSIITVQPR